jgi:internalin A
LTFAQGVSGLHSALIVAQTQADLPSDERQWQPDERKDLTRKFGGYTRFLATSAKTGFGIELLKDTVREAARWSIASFGRARISTTWAAISTELNRIHSEDLQRTTEARRHRVLTEAEFEELARACGLAQDFGTLLYYLNATGAIFWNPDLFPGRIILDQAWALDAIYAVFERANCVHKLRATRGRFTLDDLGKWLWNDRGHSALDQKLFIQFMLSCRICFVYTERLGVVTYIAPDALPTRILVEDTLALGWDDTWTTVEAVYHYELLHDGLLRGIMASLGTHARAEGIYWRGGLQFYDEVSRSRFRLTQEKDQGWAGSIHVLVQADPTDKEANPDWLAGRIGAVIRSEEERCGVKTSGPAPAFRRSDPIINSDGKTQVAAAGRDPLAKRGFFISYA